MRRAAGRVLPGERVAKCGQKALSGIVSLHHQDGHAHFGGLETCGSVWTCPVCSVRISEGRREELDALLHGHRDAGGLAYMATLTVPHHRFQSAGMLRRAVSGAFRRVKQGRRWQDARDRHGWLGDVRALEVTHGANGWHPHLHVLFLFKPGTTEETARSFGGWLYDAWARAVKAEGLGECSSGAFTWEVVNADTGAAEYVGKWGAAKELTRNQSKTARQGGRSPWQILRDHAADRNEADGQLFREYALAFKGARQLTWSRGLRKLYLAEPEPTDQELAEEPQVGETQTAAMTRALFNSVSRRGLTAHVLEAEETGGTAAVLNTLTSFGIPWALSTHPGLARGRFVPLISLASPGDQSPRGFPPLPGTPQPKSPDNGEHP
jgi:hypothetical protein